MKRHLRHPSQSEHGVSRGAGRAEAGFSCVQCHAFVSADSLLSGVQNRNHCPYCLWSCHMDLHTAGDRRSTCRSRMEPIGLTVKATRKKYGPGRGELMLVHACKGCDKLSINRIAADDAPEVLMTVFEGSQRLPAEQLERLEADGIRLLTETDRELVHTQLYGKPASTLAAPDAS